MGKLPPFGMRVPKGGSDCAKCEYIDGKDCTNSEFIKWHGSKDIPAPVDEYCCNAFEAKSRNALGVK